MIPAFVLRGNRVRMNQDSEPNRLATQARVPDASEMIADPVLTGRREKAWTPTRWTIVALAVVAGIAVGFAVGKVPPAMAVISADFGLGKVTAGWLASIFFAFGAGFGVLTGMAGGRIGARNLLLTGLLILGFASFVGGWADGNQGAGGEMFDPVPRTWQPLPSMTHSRRWHGLVAVAGGLLAVGGADEDGTPDELLDEASGRGFELPHPMAQPRGPVTVVSLPAAALAAPAAAAAVPGAQGPQACGPPAAP